VIKPTGGNFTRGLLETDSMAEAPGKVSPVA
jgi:hypothetical protein